MMNTRTLALVPVLVVIAAGSAMAQDVFHFEQIGPAPAVGLTFERPIDVMSVEPLDFGEPVTGAPYSADITTEVVQPLADGNRIERRSTSLVARDSRGRVRREQQLAAIGPILPQGDVRMVTVTDPVAGVHYSFDRERKVAMRSPLPIAKRIEGGVAIGPDVTVQGRAIVRGRAGAMIGGRTVIARGSRGGRHGVTHGDARHEGHGRRARRGHTIDRHDSRRGDRQPGADRDRQRAVVFARAADRGAVTADRSALRRNDIPPGEHRARGAAGRPVPGAG